MRLMIHANIWQKLKIDPRKNVHPQSMCLLAFVDRHQASPTDRDMIIKEFDFLLAIVST